MAFQKMFSFSVAVLIIWGTTLPVAMAATDQAIYGEPYPMQGTRLVFTNWTFVRAGGIGWVDDEGKPAWPDSEFKFEADACTWKPEPYNAYGVQIRAYPPSEIRKMEIAPEMPWESQPITLESIVEENGIYKAWGSCGAPCYLESADGIHWKRPIVGLVEFQGSKENNLIPSGPRHKVFIDPNSEDERYKCVYESHIGEEEFQEYCKHRPNGWTKMAQRNADDKPFYICLKGSVSKDGFVWKDLPQPLVVDHTDTFNVGHYDSRLKKYVVYVRTWNTFLRAASDSSERWDTWLNHARRCIGRIEGDDFHNLPFPETILEPAPSMHPTAGLYTNCFTWIPKAPECLLLFPAVYYLHNDTTDIWIASSYDGKVWNWIPGSPLMKTGTFGQWDGGCIFCNPPLLELGDGSFALPYLGSDVPHKYPRGLMKTGWGYAIWPHGRLVAIEAEERGAFSTVALIPKGKRLLINARTKRAGSIRVAAQIGRHRAEFIEGRSFEDCVPIVGDHPRTLVRWRNAEDLGIQAGEPVILRFEMEQAELFGLEFE